MNNCQKNHLRFGKNQVLCLMGESSINDRIFYSMVYREVKSKKYSDTPKKVLSFFLGKSGKNGKPFKNNNLTPEFLTKTLPVYQNFGKPPFKTTKRSHRLVNFVNCCISSIIFLTKFLEISKLDNFHLDKKVSENFMLTCCRQKPP
jgi:hypothetical protein